MQKPITNTLPADLPENWQINQAVSPTGVDVGLTEKHGYNYLHKQVNDAQKAINTMNDAFEGIQDDSSKLTTESSVVDADTFPFYDESAKGNRKTTFTNLVSKIQSKLSNTFATIASLNVKADKASPAFTGSPTAPTPDTADSSTRVATTAYANALLSSRVLVDKYFLPTLVRSEGSSPSVISGNPIPTSWTNDGSKIVNNGYAISSPVNDNTMSRVADRNTRSSFSVGNVSSGWVTLTLPEALRVTKMNVAVSHLGDGVTGTFVVQGSNDNSGWTTLSSTFAVSAGINVDNIALHSIALSSSMPYKYYRVLATLSASANLLFNELQIAEYSLATATNIFTITESNLALQTGQRVLIETPSTVNVVGVAQNTLNGVPIDTILQGSRKYELIYRNTIFNAREVF